MDFSYLQFRSTPNNTYFPLHRAQLHPRMQYPSPPSPPKSKTQRCLVFLASLFTIPFLFYLLSTARKIHQSSKFNEPKSQFFGVVLDCGLSGCGVRVYELLSEGNIPFSDGQLPLIVGSTKVRPGLGGDLENEGYVIEGLIDFAKRWVPRKEWGRTRVQLLVSGGGNFGSLVLERVLESCRKVLRKSGFSFKDQWARIIEDEEKGGYVWIAVNYALGNLGGDPQKTVGIVEFGGTSLQYTFASDEVRKSQSLQIIRLAGVGYELKTQTLLEFGQDAAWKSLYELHNTRELMALPKFGRGYDGNPCIPKGYQLISSNSEAELFLSNPVGNFTACRLKALEFLKGGQEKCLRPPCKSFLSQSFELDGKHTPRKTMFYASELFGLVGTDSLSELEAAGKHYCGDDWKDLKSRHSNVDDLDLLRYCFSSAYMVALLHDILGVGMNEERIGFASDTGSYTRDWTLGAFISHSMTEPLELGNENVDEIIGNGSSSNQSKSRHLTNI
ncbi:hypothetical protein K2173_013948 [Erythroxylum novogranatense]|uniref:Apyrase n=1 Tax=Erythroxylum novogranatense TaxID=1862640 RepID=A0AAV8SDB6_9ROSI|nr:hypothetical protein K2173_013948 [Erythroxylum novogranatense]